MKRFYKYFAIMASILCAASCNRVDESESNFDNVVYVENAKSNNTERITLKMETRVERTVKAALALPEDSDITVSFKADLSMVATYGKVNDTDVKPLPDSCFSLLNTQALITAGNVTSTDVTVQFMGLDALSKNINYVLPVTIDNAGITTLNGAKTLYYVLRKGSVINTVLNLTQTYLQFDPIDNSDALDDLTQVTYEGLIRAKALRGGPKTFMGVEGYNLFRIGDVSPVADNQMEYCGYNDTKYRTDLYFTPNKWYHVAITHDIPGRVMIVYVNGEELCRTTAAPSFSAIGNVLHLGKKRQIPIAQGGAGQSNPFFVGRSYDNNRYWDGDMAELRIWSVVRTQEEIAGHMYEVDPQTPGLEAYWKLDDGAGNSVKDYSKNALHGKIGDSSVETMLKWVAVELPPEN